MSVFLENLNSIRVRQNLFATQNDVREQDLKCITGFINEINKICNLHLGFKLPL